MLLSSSPSISSSLALFQCSLAHFTQRKWILVMPFFISYSNGYIVPLHGTPDLSHGIFPSTCWETKQNGQWLRHVFLASGTVFLHHIQMNDSFIFFIYLLSIKKVSDRDFSAYLKAEKSRSDEPWSFRRDAWSKKNPRRRGSKALYPQKAKVVAQYIPNAYTLSASMRISMGRRKKISHNVLDYGKLILRNSFFSRDLLQNHLTTG